MATTLLTTQQAAEYLSVSMAFLERARWAGSRIPFVRIGTRSIRYRKNDLDAFIEQSTCSSTSQYEEHDSRQGQLRNQSEPAPRSVLTNPSSAPVRRQQACPLREYVGGT